MRQFKAQRAFDRQLEWYERTVRALGTLAQLTREWAEIPDRALKETGFDRPLKELVEEIRKVLLDLQQCINESVLYAEQSSYENLRELGTRFKDDPEAKGASDVLRETLNDLSKPMRKMLGLKKLALKAPKK